MKFGVFLDYALAQGFEFVATGHYVRRELADGSAAMVLRGADPNKDQSYFLVIDDPAPGGARAFSNR
jgi:tRNA-uridine 2-sulfurtransferase